MKTTLMLVLLTLTATAALGQSVVGAGASFNAQPVAIQMQSHPQTAVWHEMATPGEVLKGGDYTYARGERPLWEVGAKLVEPSLGDVARALRKEHETAKRAEKYFEN